MKLFFNLDHYYLLQNASIPVLNQSAFLALHQDNSKVLYDGQATDKYATLDSPLYEPLGYQ